MSNKKDEMTIEQAFTCPKCEATRVNLDNIAQLFEDARYEDCTCMECGTKWRVYYKMKEINKANVVMAPDAPEGPMLEEVPLANDEAESVEIPTEELPVDALEPVVEAADAE